MAVMGIGIDLVDIEQAERLLDRWGNRVLNRTLLDGEHEYVVSQAHPAKHFAVRLAAKEAVYKALQAIPGARAVGWRHIEVLRAESGRPSIRLHELALELAEGAGVTRISLSLSHTELTAGAVALVEAGADPALGNPTIPL